MAGAATLPWQTDAILPLLQRTYPGELEKGELADQSGLSEEDLRVGIDAARKLGLLDEEAEHFRYADAEAPEADVPSEDAEEDGERGAEKAADADASPGDDASGQGAPPAVQPPGGPSYHAGFELRVAFAGAETDNAEERDRLAYGTAETLAGRIIEVLDGAKVPVKEIELKSVEAYDAPRRVTPPGAPDE